ncbi:transglutaminase-like domain-containing protein [Stieleria sp. JC731]|uniref:transglutaminase-like domain-containing protein n=1 Tax=Stieleria sp. JC731 TaxID=2894195 RepID=UPI001E5F908B|nr:transglutaminase-like domain-containing protein [Stieleria sp. JC731]MCC9599565.1 transglutaminase-like domain-containing protein [Stieleria sp. JC731]
MRRIKLLLILLSSPLLLTGLAGCDWLIPPRPQIGTSNQAETNASTGSDSSEAASLNEASASAKEASASFEGRWQLWYLHRMGRQVVGMSKLSAEEVIDANTIASGDSLVRYEREDQLIVRDHSMQYLQETVTTSTESRDANVKSLQSTLMSGFTRYAASASRHGNRLAFRFQVSGAEPTTQDVAWADGMRGPFGVEQSLRRQMMQAGETRRLEGLNSSLGAVAMFELRCTGLASVAMFDGTYQTLTEIEATTFVDGKTADEQVLWVKDDGVIEKVLHPSIPLESFRVEAVEALKEFRQPIAPVLVSAKGTYFPVTDADEGKMDVGIRTKDLGQVGYVVSKVAGRDRDDESLVPAFANQATKNVLYGQQVVVAVEPKELTDFEFDQPQPTADDLAQTKLLEIEHPSLVKLVQSDWEEASNTLSGSLIELVRNSTSGLSLVPQGPMRSAATVLKSGSGGEIDQAVFAAALLRVNQIPARVVFGYAPADNQTAAKDYTLLKLTAWVVAYVDDQWYSVNPVSLRINPADHLAIRISSADTELPYQLRDVFSDIAELEVQIRGGR